MQKSTFPKRAYQKITVTFIFQLYKRMATPGIYITLH